MSRSRIIFFVIIGVALLIVVGVLVVLPALNVCVAGTSSNCAATATAVALTNTAVSANVAATGTIQSALANTVTLRVIYGSEKQNWFTDAITRFEAANPGIVIDAAVEGSVAAYNDLSQLTSTATVLNKNKDPIPAVWSPASQMEVSLVNSGGQLGHSVATQCKSLVVSPLVIISWADRAKAFADFYKDKGGITLANLEDALDPQGKAQGKWANVGGNPQWGLINFAHTDPTQSNSGLMALVMIANNALQQGKPITVADITSDTFTAWLKIFEKANSVQLNSQAASSTGFLVNDMIVKGPAQYDFVIAYESLAIDNFKNALGRQGQGLAIIYPQFDVQSDHPLCIIDHPAITTAQRAAAKKFQDFLLSADIQRLALHYGFRPSDPAIALFGANTAFDDAQLVGAGLGADAKNGGSVQAIQPPDGPTLQQLQLVWKRSTGS